MPITPVPIGEITGSPTRWVLNSLRQYCRYLSKGRTIRRNFALYVTGEGWTGALGAGNLTTNDDGPPSLREDEDSLIEIHCPGLGTTSMEIVSAAAGWGHMALVTAEQQNDEKGSEIRTKLLICGRPHDFQALLRLKRLPSFIRRPVVAQSLKYSKDEGSTSPSMLTRLASFLSQEEINWDDERKYGILPMLTQMDLPDDDMPAVKSVNNGRILAASAGLTAIIGKSGRLYTFGLNNRGQCGIGDSSNNVWTPTPVMGLSTEFAPVGRAKLTQENPIVSVALGLQHGLALDSEGNLFAWGKGERGQLGQGSGTEVEYKSSPFALRVLEFEVPGSIDGRRRLLSKRDNRIVRISAGMNQSAAVTISNHVFVWGKNVSPPRPENRRKKALDSSVPILIQGLPENLKVLNVACGSHHTAILLEDGSVYAVGIATDNAEPILGEAVEIIPPGIIQMPPRQFESHFDRTTIVGHDGKQVLEVQLWSHEELREDAAVIPLWLDQLVRLEEKRGRSGDVKMVHQGWLHTLIVTDDK